MEAEARQTALDLGFVLLLSENPEKALQEAKTEFEREEAMNAIKTKRIVSTLIQTNKVKHHYINHITPQNEIYANKARKDLNNNNNNDNTNAFANLQAHNDSTPTPTTATNTEAMNEQLSDSSSNKKRPKKGKRSSMRSSRPKGPKGKLPRHLSFPS